MLSRKGTAGETAGAFSGSIVKRESPDSGTKGPEAGQALALQGNTTHCAIRIIHRAVVGE